MKGQVSFEMLLSFLLTLVFISSLLFFVNKSYVTANAISTNKWLSSEVSNIILQYDLLMANYGVGSYVLFNRDYSIFCTANECFLEHANSTVHVNVVDTQYIFNGV